MLTAALDAHFAPVGGLEPLRGAFFRWAAVHGKSYSTVEEMESRFEQFAKKDIELEEIRMAHPDATFTVDHNIFSDRTPEEMVLKLNKYNANSFRSVKSTASVASLERAPSSFGDRNWCAKYCNAVQD